MGSLDLFKNRAFTVSYNGLTRELITDIILFDSNINPIKEVKALWDTGANSTCLRADIANQLNLPIISYTTMQTANNIADNVPLYYLNIGLPNKIVINNVLVPGANLCSTEMIIGMDIIGLGQFVISNYNNKTTFSFVVPSICATDYVKEINSKNKNLIKHNIGPNAPCYCGSGKKFKNCHG